MIGEAFVISGGGRVVVAAALLVVSGSSKAWAGPDPLYPVLQVGDLVTGARQAQDIEGADRTQPFGAHPGLMPDWNHDGIFGNPPDYAIENSPRPARGRFRYPCIALDGSMDYETTSGECAPGDAAGTAFATGGAIKLRVVDSLGWELQAALFVPDDALRPGVELPGVVFANGGGAAMQTFYMYTMTLARQGVIVMNFDFAGQGQSEDTGLGAFHTFAPDRQPLGGDCRAPRACRETQDIVRWFVGQEIARVATHYPGSHDPAYQPRGDNPRNPVLGSLDTSRIGLIGQSMGSLSVSNYLWYLPTSKSAEGRPLPPIKAAIGLSGFAPASATVPYQMQTADLDIPGYDVDNLGIAMTDGPVGTKAYYDDLRQRGQGNGALELIVLESGSHGDTSNSTRWNGIGTPHAPWSWALSTAYAADWMDCYLQGSAAACRRAIAPRPHLSRAQASEYDLDGPAGSEPSRCITIPDKATIEQAYRPQTLVRGVLGTPVYGCQT